MQAANDKLLVQNGKAMQLILQAMQQDAEQSREMAVQSQALTVAMRKDGVSMKTVGQLPLHRGVLDSQLNRAHILQIALLTVFFLPGTSFAAILAMPFFTQNEWIDDVARVWVWFALTLPSTIFAFAFYQLWNRHEARTRKNVDSDYAS